MSLGGSNGEFQHIALHNVHDCAEYCFEIDEYRRENQTFLLAHLVFRKFSPTVLKKALKDWALFRKCVSAPLFAIRNDGDEKKWVRFVTLFGFEPTGIDVPCNNGAVRPLFISR